MRGDLRDLGLAGIIPIGCNEMLEAQLLIRRKGQQAEIYFERGNIVHTTLDSQGGEEVLYELLSWDDGGFSLAWLWQAAQTGDVKEKHRCRGTQENGNV